jgi:hypothetical protein
MSTINPYATLAKLARLTGDKDAIQVADAANRGQKSVTAQVPNGFNAHAKYGAIAGRSTRGLPGIRQNGQVSGHSIVATSGAPHSDFLEVAGFPSMKLQERRGGGVETQIRLNSNYVGQLTPADKAAIEKVADNIEAKARALSQGKLTYPILRKKNHPYGIGTFAPNGRKRRGLGRLTRMKGVSNLAVVNYHRGNFSRSWGSNVVYDATGATLLLFNTDENALHLAFGTKKMRAHGPFLTAPQLFAEQLNRVWRERERAAWHRQQALRGPL